MFCARSGVLLSCHNSLIGRSRAWTHSKSKPDTDADSGTLRRATSSVITGILVVGGFSYYSAKAKQERRFSECEYLPVDANYKTTNVKFVSYRGCVLSAEMVRSGTMEQIQKFKARPGDVFVSSFPKSGTTWVQEVVYQLYLSRCSKEVRQLNDPTDVNLDDNSVISCRHILNQTENVMETKFPYLEHFYPGIKEIEKRPGGRLIKTHLPVHLLPESVFTNSSKVIYIYRNPKDVAVSYYHFARMLTFINYRGSFYDFVVQFLKNQVPYSPYFPHLFGYIEKAKTNPKSVLILNYEEMKENPVREIERIAQFLNLSLQPDELEEVAQLTSFQSMKTNPATNYEHWDSLGLRDKKETTFMRKGLVGDHKNYLDPEFDSLFDAWISQNNSKGEVKFKFDLKSLDLNQK